MLFRSTADGVEDDEEDAIEGTRSTHRRNLAAGPRRARQICGDRQVRPATGLCQHRLPTCFTMKHPVSRQPRPTAHDLGGGGPGLGHVPAAIAPGTDRDRWCPWPVPCYHRPTAPGLAEARPTPCSRRLTLRPCATIRGVRSQGKGPSVTHYCHCLRNPRLAPVFVVRHATESTDYMIELPTDPAVQWSRYCVPQRISIV